jgi:hypothetical protein
MRDEVLVRSRRADTKDERGPTILHAVAGSRGLGDQAVTGLGRVIVSGETGRMLVGWIT